MGLKKFRKNKPEKDEYVNIDVIQSQFKKGTNIDLINADIAFDPSKIDFGEVAVKKEDE